MRVRKLPGANHCHRCPSRRCHISPQQLHDIAGAYALGTGRILRLIAVDDRLYADLNGHDRKELLAVGENAFASRDGTLALTFKPTDSGDQVVLNYDATAPAAAPRTRSIRERGSLWR